MKGESISPDLAPAGTGGSPRVVVGIPDSEPPTALGPEESAPAPVVEMKAPVTMPSFTKTLVQGFEPPVAAVHEADAVAEAAKADHVAEAKEAPSEERRAELPPTPDETPKPVRGALLPQAKERLEELRQRKESRERLKSKRIEAEAAVMRDAPSTDPDEVSVPPAGDLEVEDQSFFDRGEKEAQAESQRMFLAAAEADAEALIPEKARRKSMPHIVQRRAKLAGYVKVAVAGAAIVCLAALGRSAIHKPAAAEAVPVTRAEATPPEPPPAAPPPPVEPKAAEPPVEPKAADPTAAPASTDEAKPADTAAAPPTDTAAAAPADSAKPEEVTGDAKEELKKAHTALERRRIADAIEAGEKSVALDPTSGEAWLILGASYQEKGDMVNARRCYSSCLKEGKTGPRLECQKMLRF